MLCCGAYGQIAAAQPAQDNSKPAVETTKPAALNAKLVFTHAEPFQQPLLIRDQRLELTNLKLWFKNEGQAPARLLTLGTMPVLTDKILSPAEEEEFFKAAVNAMVRKNRWRRSTWSNRFVCQSERD